jgi:copper chaperone CopZ
MPAVSVRFLVFDFQGVSMMNRLSMLLAIVSAALSFGANTAHAAEPAPTTISVQGMHCVVCASKVSSNLQAVVGVQKAEVDAEKAVAVVTAKPSAVLSPRALWEAVEKAGYKPTRLVGPSGTFVGKPKS